MNTWFPLLKVRAVLISGVVLVVAGLLPVLYFAVLLVWQIAAFFQTGSWLALPATLLFSDHSPLLALLDRLPVRLLFALVGIAAMALGALSALRQMAVIRERKQRDEDRMRRVREYRREDNRIEPVDERMEPYIGSGGSAKRRVA